MKEIKKIDMRSLVILFAVVYGIIGVVGGLFFGASIIIPGIIAGETGKAILVGLLTILAVTAMYAAIGSIGGVCVAFIYNTIAKKIGGLKFYVADVAESTTQKEEVEEGQEDVTNTKTA